MSLSLSLYFLSLHFEPVEFCPLSDTDKTKIFTLAMTSEAKKSAASRKASCKILWRSRSADSVSGTKKKPVVITDHTWVLRHTHETVGLVTVTVKAGNRDYALDSYTEDQKTRISENLLRRRYR